MPVITGDNLPMQLPYTGICKKWRKKEINAHALQSLTYFDDFKQIARLTLSKEYSFNFIMQQQEIIINIQN